MATTKQTVCKHIVPYKLKTVWDTYLSKEYTVVSFTEGHQAKIAKYTSVNTKNDNTNPIIESDKLKIGARVKYEIDTNYVLEQDGEVIDSYDMIKAKYKGVDFIHNVPISLKVEIDGKWHHMRYLHTVDWVASKTINENGTIDYTSENVADDGNNIEKQYKQIVADRTALYEQLVIKQEEAAYGKVTDLGMGHPSMMVKIGTDGKPIFRKYDTYIGKTGETIKIPKGKPLSVMGSVSKFMPGMLNKSAQFAITMNGGLVTAKGVPAKVVYKGESEKTLATLYPGAIFAVVPTGLGVDTVLPLITPNISFLNQFQGTNNNVYNSIIKMIDTYYSTETLPKDVAKILDRDNAATLYNQLNNYLYLSNKNKQDYNMSLDSATNTLNIEHKGVNSSISLVNGEVVYSNNKEQFDAMLKDYIRDFFWE